MNNVLQKKEMWIDNVKIFACLFVVLGHFFQSMVTSSIIHQNELYNWFNTSIYYFHVPLFFICSGYLYKKVHHYSTVKSHFKLIEKKLINLGIPYFTFSLITWILKNVFSSNVNNQTDGFIKSLFIEPIPPYWFLYCLFFLFLITPIFKKDSQNYCIFLVALMLNILIQFVSIDIYIIQKICINLIWFSLGIILEQSNFYRTTKRKTLYINIALLLLFISLSIIFSLRRNFFPCKNLLMGLISCFSFLGIINYISKTKKQTKILMFLSRYTMHIFLLHTICAASLRSLLLKLNVTNSVIHIVLGIIISFIGPIIIGIISDKIKFLDFFFKPNKYIKIKE